MKVSILTYHWEDNYGATLQAYATYRIINELGHNAEFIDLRLPYNPSIKQRLIFGLKHFRFNCFRNKYFTKRTHKTYFTVDELKKNPPESDCYIVGRDQTWNPLIAKSLLPAFFLTFGSKDIKRISYATSIGLNEWEKSGYISNNEIIAALDQFDKILLREDSAISICKKIFKHEAEQVIDPVLLFSSYPEFTGELTPSNEIVVYKLIDDAGFYQKAKCIANKLGYPIRSIGSVRRPKGFRASYPEKVEKWVSRIANASYVLTDSFHGTVISLLYHRPFVICVGDPKRVTRIQSLLSQVGLEHRILSSNDSFDDFMKIIYQPIDWGLVDRKLYELRNKSISLLETSLS